MRAFFLSMRVQGGAWWLMARDRFLGVFWWQACFRARTSHRPPGRSGRFGNKTRKVRRGPVGASDGARTMRYLLTEPIPAGGLRPWSFRLGPGALLFVYLSCDEGTIRLMTQTFSVAPHAVPGDEFTIAPRTADFPPDPPDKPLASGKVAKDCTVGISQDPGSYWVMVNGASIGVTVGQAHPGDQAEAKRRAQEQKDADALAERNRKDKEHSMLEEPVDPADQPSENRPPNPEDQPNELPIEDNTGTTKNPTGQDAPKTSKKKKA